MISNVQSTPDEEFRPVDADARPLFMEILRGAIAWYDHTRTALEDAHHRHTEWRKDNAEAPHLERAEWSRWLDAAEAIASQAEDTLAALLLVNARRIERIEDVDKLAPGWRPAGMCLDGRAFIATPDGGDDAVPLLVAVGANDLDEDWSGSGVFPGSPGERRFSVAVTVPGATS